MKSAARILLPGLFYVLFPADLLLFGYLFQPFAAQTTWKWTLLLAALFLGMLALAWFQVRFWITPLWEKASAREKIAWSTGAAVLAVLCALLLTPTRITVLEKFPALAPMETMEIRAQLKGGESLAVQRIKILQRQIPVSSISLQGKWETDGLLLQTSDPSAVLTLTTRIPNSLTLVLRQAPDAGRASVAWAGRVQTIDLHANKAQEKIYTFDFPRQDLPPQTSWIRLLILPAWLGIAFAAISVLFSAIAERAPQH